MILLTYSETVQFTDAVTNLTSESTHYHDLICTQIFAEQARKQFRVHRKDGCIQYINFDSVLNILPHATTKRSRRNS